MKAEIINKPIEERGWFQIRLTFEAGENLPQEGDAFKLAIQEMPSGIYYQAKESNNWPQGGTDCNFLPHSQDFDGTTLSLDLGPSVTRTFRVNLYAFHIQGPRNFQYTFKTSIEDLQRPLARKGGEKIDAGPDWVLPPNETSEGKAEAKEPEIQEAKEPEIQEAKEPEIQEAKEPAADDIVSLSGETETAPPAEKPSLTKRLILILAVALLILVLAGLGLYFGLRKTEMSEPPGAWDHPPSSQAIAYLQEVREMITRGAGTAELEAALASLEKIPGAEDGVFILVKLLAARAPEHRMRYASFMDPTDPRPTGDISKAPLAAYEEYLLAKSAGAKDAEEALKRLKAWAEEKARDEDPEAIRLLQRYEGKNP